jgi:MYXO-CTERM domain-containing protein
VSSARAADPLPEGDQGIAAGYPGDAGIDGDAAVIFADDFEGYTVPDDLWDRYDNVYQLDQIRFATEPENHFAGNQALEFTVPQQEQELSNAVDKAVSPELDVLFLRYYSKFQPPFDVVGSSHNGSSISAHYFVDGQATPGIPADGTNKFLVAYEDWRGEPETMSPGLLNVYVYHPEQRDNYGDHFFPSGLVMPNTSLPFDFGPDFISRPEIIPELDRWYCWEYMVQANTPGERDGRIAAWLDGVLVADWQNLRLRDIDTLTIDRFGLSFHIGSNPNGEQKKWFDNVVAATAYIGPVYVPGAGDETGGSGGVDDTAGEGSGGGSGGSGGGGATAGGSGAGSAEGDELGAGSETGGGAPAEGDSGCACRTDDGRHAGAALALSLLAFIGRRRRPSRPAPASSSARPCGHDSPAGARTAQNRARLVQRG